MKGSGTQRKGVDAGVRWKRKRGERGRAERRTEEGIDGVEYITGREMEVNGRLKRGRKKRGRRGGEKTIRGSR